MNARKLIAATLSTLGIGLALVANTFVERVAVAPVPLSQLGLAVDHSEQAAPIVSQMPTFFVVGAEAQDNAKKNVRLWDWVKAANGGKHTENYPQQTGDCVSFGAKNAAEYFNGAAIGRGLLNSEFHPIYPPYIYGGSRVIVGKGKLGRSPGSVGAWAAEFVGHVGGVIRSNADGVPPYDGKTADLWGWKGPPKELLEAGKLYTFDTVAPVKSANEVRDAICNGYPVTIASDFGTTKIKVQDGRRVAVRNTKWYHQMCLIGFDGSASQPYFYCLNSWGPNAHPTPMQDEPPGGFWITMADVEYIVRQGDSFAYSGFGGFPAQEFVPDFSVMGAAGPAVGESTVQAQMVEPWAIPADLQTPLTLVGLTLLLIGIGLWFWRGNGSRRVLMAGFGSALAAILILPASATAQDIDWTILAQSAELPSVGAGATPFAPKTTQTSEASIDFGILTVAAQRSPVADGPALDFAILTRAANAVDVPAGEPQVATVPPAPAPRVSYPLRGNLWSHPGVYTREQLIEHLMHGQHARKFSRERLQAMTMAELESLHSDDHEGRAAALMLPKEAVKSAPKAEKRFVQRWMCINGRCGWYLVQE